MKTLSLSVKTTCQSFRLHLIRFLHGENKLISKQLPLQSLNFFFLVISNDHRLEVVHARRCLWLITTGYRSPKKSCLLHFNQNALKLCQALEGAVIRTFWWAEREETGSNERQLSALRGSISLCKWLAKIYWKLYRRKNELPFRMRIAYSSQTVHLKSNHRLA